MTERKLVEIVQMSWEESERGWGTRPDGYSIHKSVADCQQFVKEYWDKMPDAVPDEYSRPAGTPYAVSVDSTSQTYKKLAESKN